MIKGQEGERMLVLEVEVGTEKRLGTSWAIICSIIILEQLVAVRKVI